MEHFSLCPSTAGIQLAFLSERVFVAIIFPFHLAKYRLLLMFLINNKLLRIKSIELCRIHSHFLKSLMKLQTYNYISNIKCCSQLQIN